MLARRALQFGVVVLVATIAVGVLNALEVGLDLPVFDPDAPVAERILTNFQIARDTYLTWGVWVDVGTMLVFGAVLVAAPSLPAVGRSVHLLVVGAAIAVVGELIDISQLVGIEVADFALENDLASDFAAGNIYRFAVNTTSTYVWAGGVALTGFSAMVYATDAPRGALARASAMLGVALLAVAATDVWASGELFQIVSWIASAIAAYWFVVAIRSQPTTR